MPTQPLYPNESDLEVLCQRFLLWKFFSSPRYPLFNKKVSFFVFELFQKYSASKDYFRPWGWILFFIAAPASYRNNNGYCFNLCESKVCYSLCNHIFLMGIEGDSWLTNWLALSRNSQSYDDLRSALSQTSWGAGHLSSLSLKVFSRRCDVWIKITADCTHTEIYQTCKYNYSEEIAYRTESEIVNSIHQTTGENR